MLGGLEDGSVVSVSSFPIAWRVEIVEDERYRGCEYVRFFWGTANMTWDLEDHGFHEDRTPVQLKDNSKYIPCRIWKLIPVKLDERSWATWGQTPAAAGRVPSRRKTETSIAPALINLRRRTMTSRGRLSPRSQSRRLRALSRREKSIELMKIEG